jgi:hypothetical protein
VPPLLAQRLLAVYTRPGGTVLAAGGSAAVLARTALRLDRSPPRPGRRPAPGSVDLIVATPGPGGAPDAAACRGWARLLTPAGVLAVVLAPGRPPDQPALAVAAAAGAGLGYLQHIVAVCWPLHDDHLDPPHPNNSAHHVGQPVMAAAHADVLVFTPDSQATGPDPACPAGGGR